MVLELRQQHDKWKDGDFQVISDDDVLFRVPTYLLQAASSVFRDMVAAGSGAKRIELPEDARTLHPFLTTLAEGSFDFCPDSSGPDGPSGDGADGTAQTFDEVVSVVRALRKYGCRAGLNCVAQFVNTHCGTWRAAAARLFAAMHLGRDDLCAAVVERYGHLLGWLELRSRDPEEHGEHDEYDEYGESFARFALVPARYYWALATADVTNPSERGSGRHAGPPRTRFEECLRAADTSARATPAPTPSPSPSQHPERG